MKKILLTISMGLVTLASTSQTINGLFASYSFNACNGTDAVTPRANATMYASGYRADRFGNPGAALYFDGVSATTNIGHPAKALVTNGLTISAWINLPVLTGQQAIVSKWQSATSSDQYLFMLTGDKLTLAVGRPGMSASGHTGSISITPNVWHHVVALWDTSGSHQIYVDGVLDLNIIDANFKTINNTSPVDLYIGCQAGTSRYYSGSIDDVQLYDRKLNASEVQALYTQPNLINNGLVSRYSFNDYTAKDDINGNDATEIGTAYTIDRFGDTAKALDVTAGVTHLNLYDSYDGFTAVSNGAASYSFWINFKTVNNAYQIILAKSADAGCASNDRQFLLRLNASNHLEVNGFGSLSGGNNAAIGGSSTIAAGQWYHVVLTYDANITTNSGMDKYKLYLNGTPETMTVNSSAGYALGTGILDGNACMAVGTYLKSDSTFCANVQRLNASFDDLEIYNKALSTSEVGVLYTAQSTVGLSTLVNNNGIYVYPNPFSDVLTISSTSFLTDGRMELYNMEGKLLLSQTINSSSTSIDAHELQSGIYFVRLINKRGTTVQKLVK